MKRKIALLLTSVLLLVTPINIWAEGSKEEVSEETIIITEPFDTGKFQGEVPEGWTFFEVKEKEDDNAIYVDALQCSIYKGAEKEEDMTKKAGINIQLYEPGKYKENDVRKMYKNTKDVELEIENRKWTGFAGELNHLKNLILECDDGKYHWSVMGIMETDESSFTVDDKDFQEILKKLKYKEEQKKEEKKKPEEKKEAKKHNHNFVYVKRLDCNCERDGYSLYQCTECGEYEKRDYEYSEGHRWLSNGSYEPTCTSTGLEKLVCGYCGELREEVIPKLDHYYIYDHTSYAGCDSWGYEVYRCEYCGDSMVTSEIAPYGHSFYYTVIDSLLHAETCSNGCGYYSTGYHYMGNGGSCIYCGYSGPLG